MKEQELFESDNMVFQEKEEKKKKRRRKRYAKRKRKDSETGRSQEQHGSQLLENEAEGLQSLQTSEENPLCERLKEDVRKEFAIEINAQLSAENLQEKGNEFSAKHLTNRNVLKDLQDDEIGKAEKLREKKLEAERELSDENMHDDSSKKCVEKQDMEQSAETDYFNSEANIPDSKNYFSDISTDTNTTDDAFYSAGGRERDSSFSNKENFSEMQKGRDNRNVANQKKSKAGYYRHQNRRRYYKNRNPYVSKEDADDRQSENKNFKNEDDGRFTNREKHFSGKSNREESKKFSSEHSSFSEQSENKKAKNSTFQGETSKESEKVSKKLDTFQKKAQRTEERLEREKGKLPKQRKITEERTFDEASGRGKYGLKMEETINHAKKENLFVSGVEKVGSAGANFVHQKVSEHEKENSGVEAAHKTELVAEKTGQFAVNTYRQRYRRQEAKVRKAEQAKFNADVNVFYQKYLDENPGMEKKILQKQLQKKRIKREYAKAFRKRQQNGETGSVLERIIRNLTGKEGIKQWASAKSKVAILLVFLLFFLLFILMSAVSSCGTVMGGALMSAMSGCYLSEPKEIDAAELAFTEMEMQLQNTIDGIESEHDGYDEYRYNIGAIGHNPYVLLSYLSAVYTEFDCADVLLELENLFSEMYTLELTPVTETRIRKETRIGTRMQTGTRPMEQPDGSITMEEYEYEEEYEEEYEYEVDVEYEVSILETTLLVNLLESVVAAKVNTEQMEIYNAYMETKGGLQQFATPLDLYWQNYVSSYYGYRKHPLSGEEQFHRGLDIAVPEGTAVFATHDGTVTETAYDDYYGNYIVISGAEGIVTKYAHLGSVSVQTGQEVITGLLIGTAGNTESSTGSHLHMELLCDGEYYNPLFYLETGTRTLYGEDAGGMAGNVTLPESYDDAMVQALMSEAEKYLGMPYTFGGTPPYSFDCSAFVCWVFTNSGIYDLPRTTAQGIYDQCVPVTAEEVKAGDIVFFTGTYNAGRPVTHVGIYCGEGIMLHCGDPIQYASIHTTYWQSHFYGFGRLSGNNIAE